MRNTLLIDCIVFTNPVVLTKLQIASTWEKVRVEDARIYNGFVQTNSQ